MQKIFFILIFIVTLGFGATFEEGKKAFVSKDYEKAFEILNELAQRGVVDSRSNANAMFMLGDMYFNGAGVKQDYKQALSWYEKAANLGHAIAQNNVGAIYGKGLGVKQDYKKALEWLQRACKNGSKFGCENSKKIAEKLEVQQATNSSGTATNTSSAKQNNAITEKQVTIEDAQRAYNTKDYKKAFEIFEQLAVKGDAKAQQSLGYMYHWGVGVGKNYSKALELYKKACDNGYEIGCINSKNFTEKLKTQQANNPKTTTTATTTKPTNVKTEKKVTLEDAQRAYDKKDYKKAFKIFEQLAVKGDAKAQYELGSMYDIGIGVKQDYKKAFQWYEKAANQGLPIAQNSLGTMYYWGIGVDREYNKSIEWYEKAANQNLAIAQESLGYMYRDATGIAQNNQKAVSWFEKACKQGRIESCESSNELTKKLNAQKAEKLKAQEAEKLKAQEAEANKVAKKEAAVTQKSDSDKTTGIFSSFSTKLLFGIFLLISVIVMLPKYMSKKRAKLASTTISAAPTTISAAPTTISAASTPTVTTPPPTTDVKCVNCGTIHKNPTNSLCSSCGKDMYKKDTNIKCVNCGLEHDAKETSCSICGHEN